jgi:hypothetical protein
MLSRIFWVGIAAVALVTGMVLQDGDRMFSWTGQEDVSARTQRAIESGIDRTVDRSVDRMEIVGSDGRQIEVSHDARRALGEAVGEMVKAEADLAIIKIRDGSDDEVKAAETRRDQARTVVETLKAQIERQDRLADRDRNAIRDQVRQEVREDVRDTVRDAVRD